MMKMMSIGVNFHSQDHISSDDGCATADDLDSPPYYSTPSSSSGLGSSGASSSAYGSSSIMSHHTNGHVDDTEHIYEDIAVDTPQRLPKITDVLNKDKTAVVRPVAFKPVHSPSPYPTQHRISTPVHVSVRSSETPSSELRSPSYMMSHTGSLKLSLLRNNQFSLSQNSLCFENCDPQSDSLSKSKIMSPVNSVSGSYMHLDELATRQILTPSPSDSGIAELEAVLKEKDSEINYLRETIEQNEQVIFKVFEEKQHNWKKELDRIRGQYDNRLKMCQQRALKMEQLLMNQSYQLQQEKKKHTSAYERMRTEKEVSTKQINDLKKEVDSLKSQLDETRWSICQKNGEVSLLKSQLKECQNEQSNKANELIAVKSQLKEMRLECEEKTVRVSDLASEASRLRSEVEDGKFRLENCLRDLKMTVHGDRNTSELQMENEKLRLQIINAKRAMDYERGSHENERINWLEEKEKVIKYQKQLQLNYVQMFRRNHSLEREIEQLTIELEHRDYRTIGESNC